MAVRVPTASTAPAAAIAVAPETPAPAAAVAGSPVPTGAAGCPACRGAKAPTIGQAITTMVNHLFNSTFDLLSTLPGGPFTNLLEGTLVLVRRSLFLIPTGVTATQAGTELTVKVNTGSVAYLRQDGNSIEVSGLPSFRRADRFTAATVNDVAVSNPGNAGCAGFVLESGTVAASLETNQIDSLRFGSGAAFVDAVTATVTGGPLTLQDAVRSQADINFNAPVVLKNNVEISAGNGFQIGLGDVTFNGTVDAMKAGQQSLTVTALGTTTFAAPVGGSAALSSLLTRAVTPLSIQQSADTKTVPLRYSPDVSTTGKVQIKYGIDVAIGDNPSQLYEFDTGGNGFFAGYNQPFWKNVPLTTDAITVSYTSGNTFESVVANGKVTVGAGSQTVSTGQPIRVGAILTGGNVKKGTTFDFTNPAAPPVDGNFFGDFGASFDVFNIRQTGQLMASPLLQLPGNLSNGFLVQLGPIGTTDPRLTVGITDALRSQFPYAVPVSVAQPPQTYPVSGYQVLNLFGIAPVYFAQKGTDSPVPIGCVGDKNCPIALGTVIDSGAPSTGIRVTEGTPYAVTVGDKQYLEPRATLIAEFPTTAGRPALTWNLVAGGTPSVNSVEYGGDSVATTAENVNTGLNLYNNFDVMFDAQNKVIWLRPNDGAATVVAGSVTTTGDQTYRQNATLGGLYSAGGAFTVGGGTELTANTVVNAGGGGASFFGTVDSAPGQTAFSLTVNTSGATTFSRGVGEQQPLSGLTTDAAGTTATAGVTTNGNQQYGDAVSLSGLYQVLANGLFSVGGNATLTGPVTLDNFSPGGIAFSGRIDGSEGRGYPLAMYTHGGTVDINGDVGASHPLGGLTLDVLPVKSENTTTTFNAKGSINLDGSLGNAPEKGLSIGEGISKDSGGVNSIVVNLGQGGVITGYSGSGAIIGSKDGGPDTGVVSGQIGGFVISNNGKSGIETEKTNGLTLADNALIGNKLNGLLSKSDTSLTVIGNDIVGNGATALGGNGIELVGSKKTVVSGNTISTNGTTVTVNNVQTPIGSGILAREEEGKGAVDTGNSISGNSIFNNAVGITVDENSTGNSILSNSIYSNGVKTADGISLVKSGNDRQPAPTNIVAVAFVAPAPLDLVVKGTITPYTGYTGTYTIQVFVSPSSETKKTVQGRQLIDTRTDVAAGDFTITTGLTADQVGGFVTVTATPGTGPANTSEFSDPVQMAV